MNYLTRKCSSMETNLVVMKQKFMFWKTYAFTINVILVFGLPEILTNLDQNLADYRPQHLVRN